MAYSNKKPAGDGAVRQLKQDLAQGTPARLYVFYGEEGYLKRHYLSQLRQMCAGAFETFNIVLLDGEQVSVQTLSDAVDSLPMGSERKLVIVRDYKLLQPSGDMKEYLPELLSNLPDYVCLVFYFDSMEFKADKRLNLWKILEKNGQVVEFSRSSSASLIPWIRRHFDELGKSIDPASCEYLLFLCGASMDNLLTEIEKIAAGTPGPTVTRSDIDALGSRVLEATVFELTDALVERQYPKALLILRDLFDMKQEPVAILAAITKQLQRLYGAKLAQNAGYGENDTAKLLGFTSAYPARRLIQSARRCSLPYLRWVQGACLETDLALKSNLPDPQRSLELLLLRCAEAAR
ncbi:MAG: DNA polymerase III subunit delta [Clostridiaceae bacterium]|nr:DNA polymerase III subunit delta [Clostridiaceae bacterium]